MKRRKNISYFFYIVCPLLKVPIKKTKFRNEIVLLFHDATTRVGAGESQLKFFQLHEIEQEKQINAAQNIFPPPLFF